MKLYHPPVVSLLIHYRNKKKKRKRELERKQANSEEFLHSGTSR